MDEDFTAVAMPHLDTNGNEAYDFPGADDPYTSGDGPVTDSANVTVTSEEEPTETETEPPETEEQTEETTTMDSGTDEAETTDASGPASVLSSLSRHSSLLRSSQSAATNV